MTIQSFACNDTKQLFNGCRVARWVNVERVAIRKLELLELAVFISDLRVPPGNRLEALQGNLAGFYSIRINDQWRIRFIWTELGPQLVQITDYH